MARKKEGNNFFNKWDKSKLIMVAVPTVIIVLLSVVWVRAMVSSNKKLAVSETKAVSEGESATESIPQAAKSSSVSPGKPTMMSVVMAASGRRSRTSSRIRRNLPLR